MISPGEAGAAALVRATALYLPIVAVGALVVLTRPDRRRVAAAVVATAWQLPALLALNVVAVEVGWWRFGVDNATVLGVPLDLWLGWALLWGAVPLLAPVRALPAAIGLVLIDLALMPLAAPVVVLDRTWLVGEAVGVALALAPALVLGDLTVRRRRPQVRAALQMVGFTGLLGFVLPSLVFVVTGEDWGPLLDRPRWLLVLAAMAAAPPAALALQAVREMAIAGGTPVPLDPPDRLVTTGPYAYVANPMQLGATILLAGWGLVLASPGVVATALGAAAFSAGFATWVEDAELDRRFGGGWRTYRRRVRVWRPGWRPVVTEPGVVFAATTCDPCREIGVFLAARPAAGLDVRSAETCPVALRRITYVQGGRSDEGVAAIGRALEHVHLGWAVASWIGRLPGVLPLLQLITDAVGGDPRDVDLPARVETRTVAPTSPVSVATGRPDRPRRSS